MGVTGSFCQLCRLPLHDDQQDWLCDAVALPLFGDPRVLSGPIDDGVLVDTQTRERLFIWEGDDEGLAYHHYCWDRMGSPVSARDAVSGKGTYPWAVVETYRGQLFEYQDFVDHGNAWMLADPRGSTDNAKRSKARIRTQLERAQMRPPPTTEPFTSVRDVLDADRSWHGRMIRDEQHIARTALHYRGDLHPGLDCALYPTLVWAMKEYEADGFPPAAICDALAQFEEQLIAAVERSGHAIALVTTLGDGHAQYLIQTRDEAATRAAIDELAPIEGTKPVDYDNEQDPTWRVFFEKMNPSRHG